MKCKGAWKHKLIACITAAAMVVTSLTVPTVSAAAEEPDEMAVDVIAADEAAEADDALDESADAEDAVAPGEETGEDDFVAAEEAGDEEETVEEETEGDGYTTDIKDFGTPVYKKIGSPSTESETEYRFENIDIDFHNDVWNIAIKVDHGKVDTSLDETSGDVKIYRDKNYKTLVLCFKEGQKENDIENLFKNSITFTIDRRYRQNIDVRFSDNKKNVPNIGKVGSYNGHYYAFVSTYDTVAGVNTHTWSGAYNAAMEYRYMGMRGYLVTITSDDENVYMKTLLQTKNGMDLTDNPIWLGLIRSADFPFDRYNLGTYTIDGGEKEVAFKWASGPEAGEAVGSGKWYDREGFPRDAASGECCAVTKKDESGDPDAYKWTSQKDDDKRFVKGYVVEFGGYPEDEETGFTTDPGVSLFFSKYGSGLDQNLSVTGTSVSPKNPYTIEVAKRFNPEEDTKSTEGDVEHAYNDYVDVTIDEDGTIRVELKKTILGTVNIDDKLGDITVDLKGNNIEAPSGKDYALALGHTGGATELRTDLTIENSSPITGVIKGADAPDGSGNNGGAAIRADGSGSLTIGKNVQVIGGKGGNSSTGDGGNGGAGVDKNTNTPVTNAGDVICCEL